MRYQPPNTQPAADKQQEQNGTDRSAGDTMIYLNLREDPLSATSRYLIACFLNN